MSAGPLTDELARLRAETEAAYATWKEAKRALEQDQHLAAREVVADLVRLRDQILHRKPKAPAPEDRPARQREATLAFLDAVRERADLVLAPVGTSDDVRVLDLSIDRGFAEADRTLNAARRAVDRFERENAAGLKAESDRAELDRIRDAFAANDLDAVKAGLSG